MEASSLSDQELSIKCAIHVMGYHYRDYLKDNIYERKNHDGSSTSIRFSFAYSDAILDKMEKLDWYWQINRYPEGYGCEFFRVIEYNEQGDRYYATGDSRHRAIALAALAAKGVKV